MSWKQQFVRKTAFKFPFSCIIIRPGTGKPQFVVGENDRLFINAVGDLEKVDEEDIHIPPPNMCSTEGCEELTRRTRICPVCGEVE